MMQYLYAGINITAMVLCLVVGAFIGGWGILMRQKYRRFKVGLSMVKPALPYIKWGALCVVILTVVGLYNIGVLR